MSRCHDKCIKYLDRRTGEEECWNHVTVAFTRQTRDRVDELDTVDVFGERDKYSDRFIYNAVKTSPLNTEELARELGLNKKTILFKTRRYAMDNGIQINLTDL